MGAARAESMQEFTLTMMMMMMLREEEEEDDDDDVVNVTDYKK